MVSHIEELLSAILKLYFNESDVSPTTLHNIGRFAEFVISVSYFAGLTLPLSALFKKYIHSSTRSRIQAF
jgi:hypothetical protein